MKVKHIIYYGCNDEKRDTLSLRDFCLREGLGLKDIFYAVRDAKSSEELLDRFREMFYESCELLEETASYIVFSVIDVYENTNYLKLQKIKKFIPKENRDEKN